MRKSSIVIKRKEKKRKDKALPVDEENKMFRRPKTPKILRSFAKKQSTTKNNPKAQIPTTPDTHATPVAQATKVTQDQITDITAKIANLRKGDLLVLDIDETLLLPGINKYQDACLPTEPYLARQIQHLRESGISVIGLTNRDISYDLETQSQLKQIGIELDKILYATEDANNNNNNNANNNNNSSQSQKGEALQAYFATTDKKYKRLLFIDNELSQINNLKAYAEKFAIPTVLYHYVRPQHQNILTDTQSKSFPENLNGFTEIKALGGGTQSTYQIHNPQTNETFVLKYGAHPDAIKFEILCNVVYRAMGVPVPKVQAYNTIPIELAQKLNLKSPYGIFQVSELIKVDPTIDYKQQQKTIASDHFVAHSLLGNIDVAKEDNFIGGTLIDAGANFLFRAKGDRREDNPSTVSELETMRDKQVNTTGHEWFSSLTDEQIKKQVINYIKHQDKVEDIVWETANQLLIPDELRHEFLELLSDRFDRLVTRYCPEEQLFAKTDKKVDAQRTAAGILTYQIKDGKPYILLGKRVNHEWWDNLGGKSDKKDININKTAQREVAEESHNVLQYQQLDLYKSPSHDLIIDRDGDIFTYRMYITEHNAPIDINELLKDTEHTNYKWVSVEDLLKALSKKYEIIEENQKTIAVKLQDSEKMIIFPPLYEMLKQQPVQDHLNRLKSGKKLLNTHTQGTPAQTVKKSGLEVKNSTHRKYRKFNRPFKSPHKMREQVADTLLKHSHVMKEFKRHYKGSDSNQLPKDKLKKNKTKEEHVPEQINQRPVNTSITSLTQSELHLKALLGDLYQEDNIRANVNTFIKTYLSNRQYTIENKIVDQLVKLIEEEKQNKSKNFYFYHACDSKVAFAYTIYQKIYERLRLSEDWPVFRAVGHHFKNFPTINEFIAYYSKNETKKIDNDDLGFNDCAISTNVFLFGNHDIPTSNSIDYLMSNSTRRDLDLALLLKNIFAPFELSEQDIKALLDLYDKEGDQMGGALYQIALPLESVADAAYPAGSRGVINEYQGSRTLVSIIDKLEKDLNESKEHDKDEVISYMEHLQARLLMPASRQVKINKVTQIESQDLNSTYMDKAIDGVVFKILQNVNDANENMLDKTPLFEITKSVNQGNKIATSSVNETMLMKAILDNNDILVRNILFTNPKLKQANLRYADNYIDKHNPASNSTFKPIYLICTKTSFSTRTIEELFGIDWWKSLELVSLNDYSELTSILRKLPLESRDEFINHYSNLIQSESTLRIVLEYLIEEKRLFLALRFMDTIKDYKELANILEVLLPEQRIEYLKQCDSKKLITDSTALKHVLRRLDLVDRPTCALIFEDIITGDNLSEFLSLLPEKDIMSFLNSQKYKIANIDIMADILSSLYSNFRFNFILENQEHINSFDDLIKISHSLHSNEIFQLAFQFRDKINNALELKLIIDLGLAHQAPGENVVNAAYLTLVLPSLSEEERAPLVRKHIDAITSANELCNILDHLQKEDILALSIACEHLIQNFTELKAVLTYVWNATDNDTALTFLYKHQDKIKNGDDLFFALGLAPAANRLKLLERHEEKIQDGEELCKVMVKLPWDERYNVALNHIDKITEEHLPFTLDKLIINDRFKFLALNADKITENSPEIRVLLILLPEDKRLDFAHLIQHKITNHSTLVKVLKLLPYESRSNFAEKFATKIALVDKPLEAEMLAEIGETLPVNQKQLFIEKVTGPRKIFAEGGVQTLFQPARQDETQLPLSLQSPSNLQLSPAAASEEQNDLASGEKEERKYDPKA